MKLLQSLMLFVLFASLGACVSPAPVETTPYWLKQAQVASDKGLLAYENYQYPDAIDRFTEALLYYQQLDDSRGRAETRINLSRSYLALGQWQDGDVQLAWAEKLIAQNQLPELVPHAQAVRTRLWLLQDKPQLAGEVLAKLVAPADKKLSPVEQALWLNRCQWKLVTKQPLEKDLAALQAYADKPVVAARLAWIRARLAIRKKDFAAAAKYYDQALALNRRAGNPYGVYPLLQDWNQQLMAVAQWPASLALLEKMTLITLGRGDIKATDNNLKLCQQVLTAMHDPREQLLQKLFDELQSRQTLSQASLLLLFPGTAQ